MVSIFCDTSDFVLYHHAVPTSYYLCLSSHSCALHSTGKVDSVPPNVVLRLLGPNDTCNDWTVAYPDPQLKVIPRFLVNLVQLLSQSGCKLQQCDEVLPVSQLLAILL